MKAREGKFNLHRTVGRSSIFRDSNGVMAAMEHLRAGGQPVQL